jgi:hypothetical protein
MATIGQLVATTPAEIVPVAAGRPRMLSILFYNAHASNPEEVQITIVRAGGTEYTLAKITLQIKEQLIVSNLSLEPTDQLKAAATDATSVNYVVMPGVPNGAFDAYAVDAAGGRKSTAISGATIAGTLSLGTPGGSTAAAGTTTADAGVLPAATAAVYPTTAADGTKGVRVHANDKVTGRTLFIGNGVSTAILKVYAPSGGTINGAAADAAFSSVSGKGVIITCLSSAANSWLAW